MIKRIVQGVLLVCVLFVQSCLYKAPDIHEVLARLKDTSIGDVEASNYLFALRQWLGNPKHELEQIHMNNHSISDIVLPYLDRSNAAVRGEGFAIFGRITDERVCPFLQRELENSSARLDYRLIDAIDSNGGVQEGKIILERIRNNPTLEPRRLILTLDAIGRRNLFFGLKALEEVSTYKSLADSERKYANKLHDLLKEELQDRIRAGITIE